MPTFADSNRASIRYIAESTWGSTPSSGTNRLLRFTSSSLAASKETVVSDELRADRMVSSVVEVGAMTGGDVNFEFSAGSQDDFLQAFLLGAWTRPMTFDFWKGTTVSIGTTSRIDISGGDYTDYFTAGRRIKLEGFQNEENNGYRQITSVAYSAPDTQITITTTDLVVESGTAYTKVMDANDVIILRDNTLRFGTSAADEIDGNGGNPFATAVAADQLVVGQRIFVEVAESAAVFGNATVTWTGTGADDDVITIYDGVLTKTFTAGVDYTTGGTATATADNFTAAVNAAYFAGQINVKAQDGGAGITTLYFIGNTGTETLADTVDGNTEIAVTAITAATDAAIRGFFQIVAVDDDVITVDQSLPAVAAGEVVTIKSSMVKNPGDIADITNQSFSLETGFNDVGLFFSMDGLRAGTFSLDISSGAIVTGTIGFQGRATATASATVLGGGSYTPLESTATEVMNATTNVGSIYKNGTQLSTALQSVSIEGDASLRDQMAVGSKYPQGIGVGRFNLTGTITAYFETLDLYNDFIDHNTVSLALDFTDLDDNVYWLTIPAIKITSDPIVPTGIDEDVVEEMEFTAFRDSTTATMFQVDRFSSIRPVSD